jgi:hypothetical protein
MDLESQKSGLMTAQDFYRQVSTVQIRAGALACGAFLLLLA